MTGALAYLTWRSTANRVLVRVRRLREPRYAVGVVAGCLYFYWVLFRPRPHTRSGVTIGLGPLLLAHRGPAEAGVAVVLLLIVAFVWVMPGSSKPALAFSRADVQWLFPAPFTRHELVRYRVLRSQLGVSFGSALLTLFFRAGSLAASGAFFLGVLLIMVMLNLHITGVSLRRQSLAEHGLGFVHRWLPALFVVGALAAVITSVTLDWATLTALRDAGAITHEIERVLTTGVAGLVLAPFHAMVGLALAGTSVVFVRDLAIVLLMLAANYFWIARSDARFEELSAEWAERLGPGDRSSRAVSPNARVTSTPFALGLRGAPEVAFVWKNLIMLGRYASVRVLWRLVPIVIVFGALVAQANRQHGSGSALATLCLFGAGFALFMGPQMVRNDLRQDFAHLAVIRTWPLRGATIVRGEVLAPTIVLTAIVWLLIAGAAASTSNGVFDAPMAFVDRLAYAAAAVLVAPGLILAQVVMQNAIAVAFPAWVQIGAARNRGVDVMGQRLLMLAGRLVVLIVAVVPAGLVAAVVGLALRPITGTFPIVVPAIVGAGVLFVECALATEILGRFLERTDVSALDLGE